MSDIFQIAGLLTHAVVLLLGIGGLIKVVPLARGRRSGLGLVLMAVSMGIVVMEPRWELGALGAAIYSALFLFALWLLLAPEAVKRKPQA